MKRILNSSLFLLAVFFLIPGITHAQEKTESVSADYIIEQITKNEPVIVQNSVIKGDLDFTVMENGLLLGVGLKKIPVQTGLLFFNCQFDGKVTAYRSTTDHQDMKMWMTEFDRDAIFIQCDFTEEVNFKESVFRGQASFQECTFRKKAVFEGSIYHHPKTYFSNSQFNGDALFQRIFTAGSINLMRCSFSDQANFQNAEINGDFQFSSVKCYGYTDFNSIVFDGNSLFGYTEFLNKVFFNDSRFTGRTQFNNTTFTLETGFERCRFFDTVTFAQSHFGKAPAFTDAVFFLGKPDTEKVSGSQAKELFKGAKMPALQPMYLIK